MIRGDGTVWSHDGGKWARVARVATVERSLKPDGQYILDIDVRLPSKPITVRVVAHHSGCKSVTVKAVLKPGSSGSTLEGCMPEIALELRQRKTNLKHNPNPQSGGEEPTPGTDSEVEGGDEGGDEGGPPQ